MLGAAALIMVALPSCATLKTAAVEQEEINTQIQKEQTESPISQQAGRWVDANGWENEAMGDTD